MFLKKSLFSEQLEMFQYHYFLPNTDSYTWALGIFKQLYKLLTL